jgi:hypothetical protein
MQKEVDLGADRAALSERLALRCRQCEEQVPIALREAWETPEKLVLFWREDLKAVALRRGIAGGIVEEELRHGATGRIGKRLIIRGSPT